MAVQEKTICDGILIGGSPDVRSIATQIMAERAGDTMDWRDVLARVREDGATTLDLSNQQLASLPPELFTLTDLTELDLTCNKLTELPKEIGRLDRKSVV